MKIRLCICFFFYRYGENHPVFFVGTLENALKEALQGRAKDVSCLFYILFMKILNSYPCTVKLLFWDKMGCAVSFEKGTVVTTTV